ncbi:hypothetical protein [Mycoplasmopsis primatum]|uniref:hypothetical protein n=1 Tax=Mycoplasmopsis primatum TaxID=55604 RepID=UPI000495BE0E|nr:hypothetical protein [Mycoplasmopsis primatum]
MYGLKPTISIKSSINDIKNINLKILKYCWFIVKMAKQSSTKVNNENITKLKIIATVLLTIFMLFLTYKTSLTNIIIEIKNIAQTNINIENRMSEILNFVLFIITFNTFIYFFN